MNKTTLEGLEEALERLEQIDGVYSWGHLLYEVREALAEQQDKPEECAYGCPWAPTDEDTRGDYEHDIYRQRELDDEWN